MNSRMSGELFHCTWRPSLLGPGASSGSGQGTGVGVAVGVAVGVGVHVGVAVGVRVTITCPRVMSGRCHGRGVGPVGVRGVAEGCAVGRVGVGDGVTPPGPGYGYG